MNALFNTIIWDCDGAEIERESFRRIEAKVSKSVRSRFTIEEWFVARRLVHTCADFSILENLEFSPGVITLAHNALRQGATIYADSNMIKAGLSIPKLKQFCPDYEREEILCPIAESDVARYAKEHGITRALAAIELYSRELDGAIFLCGNAPLALAGVLRLVVKRGIRPALIVGVPVGFVNVEESKKLLDLVDIPFVRISGRRGGSPLAVATLHGIMESFFK
ncbi:MAG: precorrin-8X methylmutase [Victivallales bacterium]|jgi:precorrin isomerase|nr:precorrin-8X methylmutase [Victivallales bacterium]